jgi:hypothetical protein
MWLLLGLATFLAACTSKSPALAAKAPPPIRAEVAAAPGRLYLDHGSVEPADRWWESGEILFYEWKGEMQRVLRSHVARIEGQPRSREVVAGPPQTQSTLGSVEVPKEEPGPPLADRSLITLESVRISAGAPRSAVALRP